MAPKCSPSEESVGKSETRFRLLYENSPNGILLATPDGKILAANPAACAMFGMSEEELCRARREDLLGSEDSRWPNALEEWRRAGRVTAELIFVRKNGERFPVEASSFLMTTDPPHCFVIFRDSSERKRTEALLRERLRLSEMAEHASLHTVMQSALDAAEALTESRIGFFHFVNADQENLSLQAWSTNTTSKACQAEGMGRHYPIRQAGVWVDCFHKREAVIHNGYADLPHRKGMPQGHAEVLRELTVPVLRNGRVVAILGVGNKATDYNDDDVQIVEELAAMAMDIVSRKQAEEALRRGVLAQLKAENRLAARIAHEINNPLAGIQNAFRLFRDAIPKDGPEYCYLEKTDAEIKRIIQIVRQMYDLHRPNEEVETEVLINDTIRDIALMLEPLCRRHEARLVVETSLPRVRARLPEGALRRILYSLLANAIEASPREGVVRVDLVVREETLVVRIADQGGGIPEEIRGRIFEPFFSTKTGKGTEGGLGLGLPTAKQFAEALDGTLDYDCETGKGTVFRLSLRLSRIHGVVAKHEA